MQSDVLYEINTRIVKSHCHIISETLMLKRTAILKKSVFMLSNLLFAKGMFPKKVGSLHNTLLLLFINEKGCDIG